MVDLVETDLVISGKRVVDRHNESNSTSNTYSQRIFIAPWILIYFEFVNNFLFVQRKVWLVQFEANAKFLVFAEKNHAALGEVIHNILEHWIEVFFVLKFVKFDIFIFYDLKVFGSAFR